jgi:hypothetical protein
MTETNLEIFMLVSASISSEFLCQKPKDLFSPGSFAEAIVIHPGK